MFLPLLQAGEAVLQPTHIALVLNEEGWRTGLGGSFTASKVEWVRAAYGIVLDCALKGRASAPVDKEVMLLGTGCG